MIIIPLGYNCETAKFLRKNNLRKISYPFDWLITMSLNTINKILEDKNFDKNFLNNIKNYGKDNKLYLKYFGAGKDIDNIMFISNNYPGLIFRHFDFLNNIEDYKTLNRRIIRFKEQLFKKEKIIFIRIIHDGNVNNRLLKSKINYNKLDDININNLNNDINNFFNILDKQYNRKNDKLLIVVENINYFNKVKNININNVYFIDKLSCNIIT